MKRTFLFAIMFVILVSLAACAGQSEGTGTTKTNYLASLTVNIEDAMDDLNTEKTGEFAYINADKDNVLNMSVDDFNEYVDKDIRMSGYTYFTIVFGDGTGIHYSEGIVESSVYGILDGQKRVHQVIKEMKTQDIVEVSDLIIAHSTTSPPGISNGDVPDTIPEWMSVQEILDVAATVPLTDDGMGVDQTSDIYNEYIDEKVSIRGKVYVADPHIGAIELTATGEEGPSVLAYGLTVSAIQPYMAEYPFGNQAELTIKGTIMVFNVSGIILEDSIIVE